MVKFFMSNKISRKR